MVTNQQLYLAIGVPMLFNVVLLGIGMAHFNIRIDDLKAHLDMKFDQLRSTICGTCGGPNFRVEGR
jgi:hypothetical protein